MNFDQIEAARKKVSADVDVRLNAISMGDLNRDVSKLVELSGGEGKGKLGMVSHQHIDYAQIASLLDAQTRLEVLNKSSAAFSSQAQAHLTNTLLIELKNKLVALEMRRSADDTSRHASYRGLANMLKSPGLEVENKSISAASRTYSRIAISNTSTGWSQGEKLDSFWRFANDLAHETGTEAEAVVQNLSESQKQTLRRWIGI